MLFLDASALAKAYLDEEGTRNIEGVLNRAAGEVFISDFVALEVLTTLRIALRTAPHLRYQEALNDFQADYPTRFTVLDVGPGVREEAMKLTTHHRTARARSMDVLHLATALRLQSAARSRTVTLVTSDRDLASLARVCGLRTFDPSREPLAALPRGQR
jgi:predicted nucleic acid-binding protein